MQFSKIASKQLSFKTFKRTYNSKSSVSLKSSSSLELCLYPPSKDAHIVFHIKPNEEDTNTPGTYSIIN